MPIRRFLPRTERVTVLAGVLLMLGGLLQPLPGRAETPSQALVIMDLRECGHPEYILFTVLYEGRVGVATAPTFSDWIKPAVGDRLQGQFLQEGDTEVLFLNRPETTELDVVRTQVPIARQGELIRDFCAH